MNKTNLKKLAKYLKGELKSDFNMIRFQSGSTHSNARRRKTCGAIGCAVGHGPYAGIPKSPKETWGQYSERVFGLEIDSPEWYWCFSGRWSLIDNTATGAAKRILWLLKHGRAPDNTLDQVWGYAPLSY